MPGPGLEFRTLSCKVDVLTSTLLCLFFSQYGGSAHLDCYFTFTEIGNCKSWLIWLSLGGVPICGGEVGGG